MKLHAFILFVIVLFDTLYGQEGFNLYSNLNLGPYDVGTKQIRLDDTSGYERRDIGIKLWYPTATIDGDKLAFADYLNHKNQYDDIDLANKLSIGIGGKEDLFSPDTLTLLLESEMSAIADGEEKAGKFPLLVWSMRYETVEYQSVLSEFLASNGYVVAFAEDIPNSVPPWQIELAVEKENSLNQQISVINFSIEYLKRRVNIDAAKTGLLSWSYAGESALLSQIRNQDIDLVVGLSSIGFSNGVYLGGELRSKLDQSRINAPYLILFEKVAPNGNERSVPDLFDSMHPNSRHIFFKDLAHGNFNSMEGMIPGIMKTDKVQGWSKGGEVAQKGYETIVTS